MKNNTMKKILVTSAVVVALASATLAGCGNSTSSSTTTSNVSSKAATTGTLQVTTISENTVKFEAEKAAKGMTQKVSFKVGENENVQVEGSIKDNGKYSLAFAGTSGGTNSFAGGDGKFSFSVKAGTYELTITSETENLTGTATITTVPRTDLL